MLKALRDDGKAQHHVASVDTADTPGGQLMTVMALGLALQGKNGDNGVGPGADGTLPTPEPTPTTKK
jgi:hypothetical protein